MELPPLRIPKRVAVPVLVRNGKVCHLTSNSCSSDDGVVLNGGSVGGGGDGDRGIKMGGRKIWVNDGGGMRLEDGGGMRIVNGDRMGKKEGVERGFNKFSQELLVSTFTSPLLGFYSQHPWLLERLKEEGRRKLDGGLFERAFEAVARKINS